MKHSFLSRMMAICLCLCLLPTFALAYNGDETPVTRTDFSVRLLLHPEGFPNDGAAHYADWAKFLDKVSLRGVIDTQHFLMPLNRMYFEGGLYLGDQLRLPFSYDSYITFRYLRSPALRGEYLHFQMNNFFQFMLKGYYFMGLPTQLIAIPMYPEAATDVALSYMEAVGDTFKGKGSRTVDYDELCALCERLDDLVLHDQNDRLYYLVTCLLLDLGASDMVLEKLSSLEDCLELMDPDCEGLKIRVSTKGETWTLGETVVFEKNRDGFVVTLPDPEGYVYRLSVCMTEGKLDAQLLVTLEDEERLNLTVTGSGLPQKEKAESRGWVEVSLTGDALYEEVPTQRFLLRFDQSSQKLPYHTRLNIDWVHPETGDAAISLRFEGKHEEKPAKVLEERQYAARDDFFHLNESFMAEYKERYLPTLAIAALPFVMEMPAGILSDVVAFMDETGFLAFFGLE